MSSKLHYKGYTAEIYYSAEDNLIFGKLEDIKDLVNFHSDNTNNIVQHFHDAVDDYLELCAEIDKEPEKPYETNSCNFCSKIWNNAEEYELSLRYPWNVDPAIVMQDGKPYIYVPCEDSYYSRCVTEASYCPVCGRKIMEV